jgi:hypothetical protein
VYRDVRVLRLTMCAPGTLLDLDSPRSALSVVGGTPTSQGDTPGVGTGGRGDAGAGGPAPPRLRASSPLQQTQAAAAAAAAAAGLQAALSAKEEDWCQRSVVVGGWDRRPWFRRVHALGVDSDLGYPTWSGSPKEFLKRIIAAASGDAGACARVRGRART